MTTPSRITVSPAAESESDAVFRLDQLAFAFGEHVVEREAALSVLEWDRTFVADLEIDDADPTAPAPVTEGLFSGLYTVYSLRMPVPGAEVPCAGVSWVSVHPQHRRRGVLSAMMRHHFEAVREAGTETISALHASESGIYGRFGYGAATQQLRYTLPHRTGLRAVPGEDRIRISIEAADAGKHADAVGRVYEAARSGRPGMVGAVLPVHITRRFDDPEGQRDGGEALKIMLALDASGEVRGYALFARKWGDPLLVDGTVRVRELAAADSAAAVKLWRTLVDLDLMRWVETDDRAVDDPLSYLLTDPRSTRPSVVDGVYVRLVDLPGALSARRYRTDVDVVLDVSDSWCPWNSGRWRLSGGPDGAVCAPTSDAPDLTLDTHELASAYLGSHSLSALASAGLLSSSSDAALTRAATAFSWPVASTCAWGF